MAVVRPVYLNNGNVQEMDDTMFGLLKDVFRYQFFTTSPITLSVVSSGGNLSGLPITDTRMQAGAMVTRAGDGTSGDDGAAEFPPESTSGVTYAVPAGLITTMGAYCWSRNLTQWYSVPRLLSH